MRFLIRTLGNMAGLWLSTLWVPGIHFQAGDTALQTWGALALVAAILSIVTGILRPIIKTLTFPLYILTLGLFSLITNAIILTIVAAIAGAFSLPFAVDSFGSAIVGGLLTAIVSALIVSVAEPLLR